MDGYIQLIKNDAASCG